MCVSSRRVIRSKQQAGTVTAMAAPPDLPAYRRVADDIRNRIRSGELIPGALIPAEPELQELHNCSRGTVRKAMALLQGEGLIDTFMGRGSQVRLQRPIRRLDASRYRLRPQRAGGGFTAGDVEWSHTETTADGVVAERLQVEIGTPVLARRYLIRAHGVPQQMSTSYVLLDLVAGTPVADLSREPWPGGVVEQLASLGIEVTQVREEVRTRMPSPEERDGLQIAVAVPVLALTRTMLADDRPVEAGVEIVIPGDRVVLDYVIDL